MAGLLGACGPPADNLSGTWTIVDGGGTETLSCPSQGQDPLPVETTLAITGQVLIVQGSTGVLPTIVAEIAGASETFSLNDASDATLQPGSNTFLLATDAGAFETLTVGTDTLKVGASNLVENGSGTLQVGDGGVCNFTRSILASTRVE